jgi:hypothetical protein
MKSSFLRFGELIIPLTLLAFAGPGISFISGIFNTTTRWLFLALLTFFLIFFRFRDVASLLRRPFFWIIMAYAGWCFLTTLWSEVPVLSFAKSMAFLWLTATMTIAGYSWVARHERAHACDFLWLFAIFSLMAALFGHAEVNGDTGSVIYSGATGNANLLGFLLAAASPWLIWQAWLAYRKDRVRYRIFMGLLIFDAYYLFLSHSRAAQLIAIFVVLGLLLAMGKLRKALPYVMVVSVLFFSAYTYSPAFNIFVTEYVFKSNLEYLESFDEGIEGGLWYSRQQLWEDSYARAMHGGMLGAGYGVSMGEKFTGEIGVSVSSGQYGREQGNAQMAIVEQTGFVGFGLYLVLIVAVFRMIIQVVRSASTSSDKIAVGLLGGTLVGLLVQSLLEAWWVAPGSAESGTFWMLLGALLATARRAQMDLPVQTAESGDKLAVDAAGVMQ